MTGLLNYKIMEVLKHWEITKLRNIKVIHNHKDNERAYRAYRAYKLHTTRRNESA